MKMIQGLVFFVGCTGLFPAVLDTSELAIMSPVNDRTGTLEEGVMPSCIGDMGEICGRAGMKEDRGLTLESRFLDT